MGWNDEPLPPERRSPSLIWWGGLLVVAAAILSTVTIYRNRIPEEPPAAVGPRHPAVGTAVTEVSLQPLLVAKDDLRSADLAGKVTLINFWGTWCPPCQVEFPHIAELANSLKKEPDFKFLSVSVASRGGDERLTLEPTSQFVKRGGHTFPVYIDQQSVTRLHLIDVTKVGENFGYPATVVLDRGGVIRGFWVGYVPGWELEIATVVKNELKKK